MSLYDIPFHTLAGQPTTLAEYRGKVLLLVNVASRCGLTPQYAGLEKLYQERHPDGLVVVGFPANDFGAQEPGSSEEIAQFCSANFGVSFPLAQKIAVKGPAQHPLYAWLTAAQTEASATAPGALRSKLEGYGHRQAQASDVLWNFEKFLVDGEGRVVGRFSPDVAPDDPLLVQAIDRALDKN